MNSKVLLISIILFAYYGCQDREAVIDETVQPPATTRDFLINLQGDTIPTGISIPVSGNEVHTQNTAEPRKVPVKTAPKIELAHKNEFFVGEGKIVEIPHDLTVITPGKNGIPLPKTVPAEGNVVVTIQPPSRDALPLAFNENASLDIQYLDAEQGMSSSFVWDIVEDRRGHLWFGTGTAGIIRYNGHDFTNYTTREGLSNNTLRAMLEDSHGHLWFATDGGGLCKYDGRKFTHYTKEGGLSHNVVYAIIEDSQGILWIGTRNGLDRYDGHNFTHYTSEEGLCGNVVRDICEDKDGILWIGTVGGGLCRFDPGAESGMGRFTHFTTQEGLSNDVVRDICEDKDGIFWIATAGGINRFDGTYFTHFTVDEGLSDNVVWAICEDQWGDLWFGTQNGLSRYVRGVDGDRFIRYTVDQGLSNNWIISILEDRQGHLWLGTRGGGVNRYDRRSFSYLARNTGLEDIWISSILEDKQGSLWLGTRGNGLVQYDGKTLTHFTKEQGLHHNDISSIQQDKQGNLWIGMFGPGGVDCFDGRTFTHFGSEEGLISANIWSMLYDRQGSLWLGTWFSGATKYEPTAGLFSHFTMKQGLGSNAVLGLMEDGQGNIWFGTRGGGVSRYDGNHLVNFDTEEGFSVKGATGMMADRQGYLWFGGDGLYRYDPRDEWNHFIAITTKDGLADNDITSIQEDNDHNIWVGTANGISVLSPKDSASAFGNGLPYHIHSFGEEDGLKKTNLSQGGYCLDRQNRLWWGSVSGLTMLDLNQFEISSDTPVIMLNTIEIEENFIDYRRLSDPVYQKSIQFEKPLVAGTDSIVPFFNYPQKLTLPAHLNHLTFHYYAIDWSAPHKLRYRFMIEGLDDGWSTPRPERKVDYRNLPYGNYVFKVKASGESKVWTEPVEYPFTILPPWYHTWWARLLYFLLLVLMISAYVRWRTHALRKRQRELEQTVTERTAEVVAEKERSEELLLNILPSETARELKEYGAAKAKNYDMVTVLFADFQNFTKHAELLTPEELVNKIDYCFKAFDRIMEQYQVEKIKTIGDAYMAAAGLPIPNTSNPMDAVHAAIAMRDFMLQYQHEAEARGELAFEMRIGLHSGPVVAGIVGIKKFAYDIWGDTVNLASRMESSGETGRVNISHGTYDLLKDHPGFSFEPRGMIQVKNKGEIAMYFVEPIR